MLWLFLIGALVAPTCFLNAADPVGSGPGLVAAGEDIDDRDIQALREWINTKRQVTVKELGGSLSVSGEVHFEFQSSNETIDGVQQRGAGSLTAIPRRGYDVEATVLLDYRGDRSWSSIRLKFDNDAGILGGTNNKIVCDRAYWAYRILDGDTYTFDVEAGRRVAISEVFDSQIEFGARFDGVVFKYDQAFDSIGSFYVHTGGFIVNERHDQYGVLNNIKPSINERCGEFA